MAALAAIPWGAAHAASDSYEVGGGASRCAYASGKVTGGTAWVEICQSVDTSVTGQDTDVPDVEQPTLISGEVHVATTRGRDDRTFSFNPSSPNQGMVNGFVMDPGMNTAQIQLTVATITVNVTLTAKTEAPDPYQHNSANAGYHQNADPELDAYANGSLGAGVSRRATVTGSINSTTRGGGALSSASGDMHTGGGASFDACASSSDYSFMCFFIIGP